MNTWYPPTLRSQLEALERHGAAHDAVTADRAQRLLNITPDTGAFLAIEVQVTSAKRILEIGTSNGYSTLWLAWAAASEGGHVTSIDIDGDKTRMADSNLDQAGLRANCTLLTGDAAELLGAGDREAWDLIFLDADRSRYEEYWPALRRALRPGGLLIVDNALSHPAEVLPLQQQVARDPSWGTVTLPIGKGEWMALKPK